MLENFAMKKAAGASAPDFNGIWQNELSSQMELSVVGVHLTGVYRTGVGLPTPAEEFELVGFVADDMISFSVDFGKYGSLTSWVGQYTEESGVGILKSMWLLSRNVPDVDEPGKLWGSVLTGYNNFSKVA